MSNLCGYVLHPGYSGSCDRTSDYISQEKCIEYILFYDVNEMIYTIITIVNIPLILYHVLFKVMY